MIIFLSMLIPFCTAAVLWFGFKHKTKWWEFLIPFGASLFLSLLFYAIISFVHPLKNEYWTNYLTQVKYYEPWNEKVYYNVRVANGTETYRVNGQTRTRTKYKTVRKSRIDSHPARWVAIDNGNSQHSIDHNFYKELSSRWGNVQFEELNRNFYSKDGDLYFSNFNNQDKDMEDYVSIHSYVNKVVKSNSVFNFQEVTPEIKTEYALVDYPSNGGYSIPSILGKVSFPEADKELSIINAKYGQSKEIRIWWVIFQEKTLEAAIQQQNYWKNGNMNEFVVCIGLDKQDRVQWGHAFSWTDVSELPIKARNEINEQKNQVFNPSLLIKWTKEELIPKWKRKDFEKDFDYIENPTPTWAIILTVVLTLALNVALSYWIIHNEHSDK